VIISQDRGGLYSPAESPDGKSLFYQVSHGPEVAFVKRDLGSGGEMVDPAEWPGQSELVTGRPLSRNRSQRSRQEIEPVAPRTDRWRRSKGIDAPHAAGDPRNIRLGLDSKSLLVRIISEDEKFEIWRVAIDGSPAVKLPGTVEGSVRTVRLAPDGKAIAFQVTEPPKPTEIWVTENFLPK
jgi:hypothetical protein